MSMQTLRDDVQDSRNQARDTVSAVKQTFGTDDSPAPPDGSVGSVVRIANLLKRHSLTALVISGVAYWAIQGKRRKR